MIFSVCNTKEGYVVMVCIENHEWHPLRNFGDHQGDAIMFCDYDCPRLDEHELKLLIKNYDASKVVERINARYFIRQREWNSKEGKK